MGKNLVCLGNLLEIHSPSQKMSTRFFFSYKSNNQEEACAIIAALNMKIIMRKNCAVFVNIERQSSFETLTSSLINTALLLLIINNEQMESMKRVQCV